MNACHQFLHYIPSVTCMGLYFSGYIVRKLSANANLFFDKKKKGTSANLRPSLHFYGMISWGKIGMAAIQKILCDFSISKYDSKRQKNQTFFPRKITFDQMNKRGVFNLSSFNVCYSSQKSCPFFIWVCILSKQDNWFRQTLIMICDVCSTNASSTVSNALKAVEFLQKNY